MNITQLPNGNYQIESLTTKGKFYQVNLQDRRCNCPHWVKINKGHNDKPTSCKHVRAVGASQIRASVNLAIDELLLAHFRFQDQGRYEEMFPSFTLDGEGDGIFGQAEA